MEDKLINIMEDVFGTDIKGLEYSKINPENIAEWDSFSHLSLISSIEDEWGIELSVDDIKLANEGFNVILEIIKKAER